jgi:hypothetical protein
MTGSARARAIILRRRLQAQLLSTTAFARPEDAVAWLGAVQAQDYLGALWAVGLRVADARERDVERALAERRIVRTWPMRGTLHFVAAADARWMTELLAPKVAVAAANRLGALGIDGPLLARAQRVLVKNLEGGRRLTRPEAYRVLESARIATDGQRGLLVLWRLAHDCLLCFGPREGKQQTFVLFDEWLPNAKRLHREEALAELARRYFTGHGPATLADFAWWSGLKLADARLAVAIAEKRADERIEEETLDGQRHWFRPPTASFSRVGPMTHVLPAFDEFLVGYADRSAAIDPSDAARLSLGGISNAVVIVDGQVIGTWKRRIGRREVVFATAPFAPLNERRARALELELRRYANFLGLDIGRAGSGRGMLHRDS